MTEVARGDTAANRPGFRSAVVPAAGLGTRFLPTTKAVPKELLPVVDTPGIKLLIITAPDRDAPAAHFADSSDLQKVPAERGKSDLVAKVRRAHELLTVRSVIQPERLAGEPAFAALERIEPGTGGELNLTDAIQLLIPEGHPVRMVVHHGRHHDLADPGGYLRASVDAALDRPEDGPDLRAWLAARLEE